MSRFLRALLVVPVLVLAAATAACAADEGASFATYRNTDPNLPVAFEYPADWKVMRPAARLP